MLNCSWYPYTVKQTVSNSGWRGKHNKVCAPRYNTISLYKNLISFVCSHLNLFCKLCVLLSHSIRKCIVLYYSIAHIILTKYREVWPFSLVPLLTVFRNPKDNIKLKIKHWFNIYNVSLVFKFPCELSWLRFTALNGVYSLCQFRIKLCVYRIMHDFVVVFRGSTYYVSKWNWIAEHTLHSVLYIEKWNAKHRNSLLKHIRCLSRYLNSDMLWITISFYCNQKWENFSFLTSEQKIINHQYCLDRFK